jgi:hypothetical protein
VKINCIQESISVKLDGPDGDRIRLVVTNDIEGEEEQYVMPLSSEAAYRLGVLLVQRATEAQGKDWKLTALVFDNGDLDEPEYPEVSTKGLPS